MWVNDVIVIPAWSLGLILALGMALSYTLGWYGTFDRDDDDEGGA